MDSLDALIAARVPKSLVTTAGDILYATASSVLARLGLGAAGTVLGGGASAPAWVTPPGAEIGYDQITGNVTVSSTTEATGTTVIAGSAHTFDGAPVIAEFYSEFLLPASVNASLLVVNLFEGATQIARLTAVQNPSAANGYASGVMARLRFTPTAGVHTYTVTAFQGGGSGFVVAGPGGTAQPAPTYLRFTKV